MTKKEVAKKYIEFLSAGHLDDILSLFAENATVHSPIYGENDATTFYKILIDDTENSKLQLKGIFEDSESANLALHFEYTWTLKSTKVVAFDVVDIIEFDNQNKIIELKIIYDTVVSRQLVNELKKNKNS